MVHFFRFTNFAPQSVDIDKLDPDKLVEMRSFASNFDVCSKTTAIPNADGKGKFNKRWYDDWLDKGGREYLKLDARTAYGMNKIAEFNQVTNKWNTMKKSYNKKTTVSKKVKDLCCLCAKSGTVDNHTGFPEGMHRSGGSISSLLGGLIDNTKGTITPCSLDLNVYKSFGFDIDDTITEDDFINARTITLNREGDCDMLDEIIRMNVTYISKKDTDVPKVLEAIRFKSRAHSDTKIGSFCSNNKDDPPPTTPICRGYGNLAFSYTRLYASFADAVKMDVARVVSESARTSTLPLTRALMYNLFEFMRPAHRVFMEVHGHKHPPENLDTSDWTQWEPWSGEKGSDMDEDLLKAARDEDSKLCGRTANIKGRAEEGLELMREIYQMVDFIFHRDHLQLLKHINDDEDDLISQHQSWLFDLLDPLIIVSEKTRTAIEYLDGNHLPTASLTYRMDATCPLTCHVSTKSCIVRPFFCELSAIDVGEVACPGAGWSAIGHKEWFGCEPQPDDAIDQLPTHKRYDPKQIVSSFEENVLVNQHLAKIRIKNKVGSGRLFIRDYQLMCDFSQAIEKDPTLVERYPSMHLDESSTYEFWAHDCMVKMLDFEFVQLLEDNDHIGKWVPLPPSFLEKMKRSVKELSNEGICSIALVSSNPRGECIEGAGGSIHKIVRKGDNGYLPAEYVTHLDVMEIFPHEAWLEAPLLYLSGVGSWTTVHLGAGYKSKPAKTFDCNNDTSGLTSWARPPDRKDGQWSNWWTDKTNNGHLCAEGAVSNLMWHLRACDAAMDIRLLAGVKSFDDVIDVVEIEEKPPRWLGNLGTLNPLKKCAFVLEKKYKCQCRQLSVPGNFDTPSMCMKNFEKIDLPMFVQLKCIGDRIGFSHVVAIWRGHIIDLEEQFTYPLTVDNLHYACGYGQCFQGISFGYMVVLSRDIMGSYTRSIDSNYSSINSGLGSLSSLLISRQKKNRKNKKKRLNTSNAKTGVDVNVSNFNFMCSSLHN